MNKRNTLLAWEIYEDYCKIFWDCYHKLLENCHLTFWFCFSRRGNIRLTSKTFLELPWKRDTKRNTLRLSTKLWIFRMSAYLKKRFVDLFIISVKSQQTTFPEIRSIILTFFISRLDSLEIEKWFKRRYSLVRL